MSIKHSVEIQAEVPVEDIDLTRLKVAALATLKHQKITEASELTIVISDDETLHELNRRFRGVDRPTDVLSFPNDTRGPFAGNAAGFPCYLGDIVISRPRAAAQAEAAGGTLTEELQLLIVHGTLHLLSYEHAEPAEKARMWKSQAAILQLLSIDIQLPE
ncbi:MAG: rRNA maturation RNase YbeY [Chloroflexota bacterium]|nr:rRNA maturation RNase YbeY [Chloroflexota bacterium]